MQNSVCRRIRGFELRVYGQGSRLVHGPGKNPDENPLSPAIEQAGDNGLVSFDEEVLLDSDDVAVSGTTEEDEQVYVVGEASYTVTERDVATAKQVSGLPHRITGGQNHTRDHRERHLR